MRLRLLGTSSGKTGCPALYETDRGTYVVQGKLLNDPEAIADLVDVRDDEFYVEVPPEVLKLARGPRE
ncbi:hypothetical protein [Nonomuraea sp. NPDC048901]|uniref:hypothetical protein n=1 Tax=Nonomuraea sp. NPDC048901 TaxID=3155627 RepID=UPI0033E8036F